VQSHFEKDFEDTFLKGLGGLRPDGAEDALYRGRTTARNSAVGGYAPPPVAEVVALAGTAPADPGSQAAWAGR
jgi:hypothetical protein